MNTKLHYMYRDGDNYKQHNEVILKGILTIDEKILIFEKSADLDTGFIPSKVGLEDLQHRFVNGYDDTVDHPFHEIISITETHLPQTLDIEVKQLLTM